MNILLPLVVLALGLTLLSSVSDFFVSSRKSSVEVQMQTTKMDAVREMGSVVRSAYDTYVRTGGACTLDTKKLPSTGSPTCWPKVNDGCFNVGGMQVCRSSGFVTDNSGPSKQFWVQLLLPQALAARTPPSKLSPLRTGASSSVRIVLPGNLVGPPANATTFAPACGGTTVCITVTYCVDRKKRNTCASSDSSYVTQTYAFWTF